MLRYKFESNSQRLVVDGVQELNVYAMLRYKFESNSQRYVASYVNSCKCVCYA
jgi:hypothetical protein